MFTRKLGAARFWIVLVVVGLPSCDDKEGCKEAVECKTQGKCTADEKGVCKAPPQGPSHRQPHDMLLWERAPYASMLISPIL